VRLRSLEPGAGQIAPAGTALVRRRAPADPAGWFFGEDALKQELLAAVSEKAGKWHYGEAVQESAEAQAERIVTEELNRRSSIGVSIS
jgi:hypothetical protein